MRAPNKDNESPNEAKIYWSKSNNPVCNLLLSHGGGQGLSSNFMEYFAYFLPKLQINVGRI